jgi:hypothetical protein
MVDFVADCLERIRRADAAMDDDLPLRAKHERSVAHIYAVLACGWPMESLEQVEGRPDSAADPWGGG